MKTPTPPDRLRQDARLIRQTLRRLAASRLIARTVVIAIAIILWLLACRWLLAFGRTISYDGLAALDQQVIDFLARINPYLWGTAALLVALVILFAIKAWFTADAAALRARPVPIAELTGLAPRLAGDSLDVVRWVWRDRGEPLSIGDLSTAAREIRTGRVAKMYEARAQAAALADPDQGPRRSP